MRKTLGLLIAIIIQGCVTPRSVGTGITAAPLGPGVNEVGVSAGFTWQTQTNPPTTVSAGNTITQTWQQGAGVQIPAAEANAQFGLTRMLGLNLHLSPAGIQPGLKVTLLERAVTLGLMPDLGLGWTSGGTKTIVFTNQNRDDGLPQSQSNFVFLGGLRFLLMHPGSGAYGSVGYQYQTVTQTLISRTGSAENKSSTTTTLHNVVAAVGYEFKRGALRIRPELAFEITPELGMSTRQNEDPAVSMSGGNSFFIFPNVTFAIAGEAAKDRDEDEVREAPARGDEDEDEDEGPRRRGKSQRHREEDDSEGSDD